MSSTTKRTGIKSRQQARSQEITTYPLPAKILFIFPWSTRSVQEKFNQLIFSCVNILKKLMVRNWFARNKISSKVLTVRKRWGWVENEIMQWWVTKNKRRKRELKKSCRVYCTIGLTKGTFVATLYYSFNFLVLVESSIRLVFSTIFRGWYIRRSNRTMDTGNTLAKNPCI